MYIPPCVDYYDVVWDCCSKQDSNRLQILFNYACRIALHHPCLSSSSALWNYLGLSSLSTRRKLHLAQLMLNSCSTHATTLLSLSIHLPFSTNHLTDTPPAIATELTSHLYLCVNICMVTNQLLHDNKHSIIIYSNPTSTHMAVISFFACYFLSVQFSRCLV